MTTILNHVQPDPSPRWFTIFQSQAYSATTNILINTDSIKVDGLIILFEVTALSGTTPSVTFQAQGWDPLGLVTYELGSGSGLTTGAVTATGQKVFRVMPALVNGTLTASDMPPSQLLVTATIAGTTPSVTFSGAAFIYR